MTDEQKQIVEGLRAQLSPERFNIAKDTAKIIKDAADLIEAMAVKIDAIEKRQSMYQSALSECVHERDAAVRDINAVLRGERLVCSMCDQEICPEYANDEKPSGYCDEANWRGLCAENGGTQ